MRRLFWTSALSLALLAACGGSVDGSTDGSFGNVPGGGGPQTYRVDYNVIGTTDEAVVTYTDDTGASRQVTVTLPWTREFVMSTGDALLLSARNARLSGSVTATIRVDDEVFDTDTQTGAEALASASGTCC